MQKVEESMRWLRKFAMGLAEILQIISICFWTACGAAAGLSLSRMMVFGLSMQNVPIDINRMSAGEVGGMLVGGLSGFTISATAAAFMFTLTQIEANTNEAARFYRMMRKKQEGEIRAR
jgi:hypothetical protein